MENENIDGYFNKDYKEDKDNIFELDFANQNIENNTNYKKWEKNIKNKYGKNIRILRCLKDKIFFCSRNEDDKDNDPLTAKCPLCQDLICFYCSRYSLYEMFIGNCCLRRGIYYLFFYKSCQDYLKYDLPDCILITLFFIPYAYLPVFMKLCFLFFFEGLPKITSEDKGNGELVSYGKYYHENKETTYYIITYIHTLFIFVLSIPFTLIDFGFHILLLAISIPLLGLPILYHLGIVYGSAHPDFYIQDLIYKIYFIDHYDRDYYDLPLK